MPRYTEKQKRRVMRKFKLGEVSFVNKPAQAPATADIAKAADLSTVGNINVLLFDEDGFKKAYEHMPAGPGDDEGILLKSMVDLASSSDEGHQHGIRVRHYEDGKAHLYVSYSGGDEGAQHDHDIIIGEDGSVTMTENMGHTHTIDSDALRRAMLSAMTKVDGSFPEEADVADLLKSWDLVGDAQDEEATMADDTKTQAAADLKAATDRIAELEKSLDDALAKAGMTDAEKTFMSGLGEKEAAAFKAMSGEDRKKRMTAAKADDEIVYTADNGATFHKSDDPRVVEMAKGRDQDRRELKKAREANDRTRREGIAKSDMAHMPGELDTLVAIIEALEGIEKADIRDKAFASLRAHDTAMSKNFDTLGKSNVSNRDDVNTAGAKVTKAADAHKVLEEAAAELMKNDATLNQYDAYDRAAEADPETYALAVAG